MSVLLPVQMGTLKINNIAHSAIHHVFNVISGHKKTSAFPVTIP
jgi:hypothetical protein